MPGSPGDSFIWKYSRSLEYSTNSMYSSLVGPSLYAGLHLVNLHPSSCMLNRRVIVCSSIVYLLSCTASMGAQDVIWTKQAKNVRHPEWNQMCVFVRSSSQHCTLWIVTDSGVCDGAHRRILTHRHNQKSLPRSLAFITWTDDMIRKWEKPEMATRDFFLMLLPALQPQQQITAQIVWLKYVYIYIFFSFRVFIFKWFWEMFN